MDFNGLLDEVLARLGPGRQRGRELHCDCPYCGKEATRGQQHFSINLDSGQNYCFVCRGGGSIQHLADRLRIETNGKPVRLPQRARTPAPERRIPWLDDPEALVLQYEKHERKFERWHAYKDVPPEIVERHRFGVGRLPFLNERGEQYFSHSEWLIVPLFAGGKIVGLRGRNQSDQGPKWISATGTKYVLFNVERVEPEKDVIICENYVDAALVPLLSADLVGVAVGGVAHFKPEWATQIAARQPASVTVLTDNDLAGQARGAMRAALLDEWRFVWMARHPRERLPPEPVQHGPRIAAMLQRAGVKKVGLFRWPDTAPAKADLGWIIENARVPQKEIAA